MVIVEVQLLVELHWVCRGVQPFSTDPLPWGLFHLSLVFFEHRPLYLMDSSRD